ncbi:transmembrane 6 superfamily member 1 isoform X2 [Aplysia californica]|uniref:Transmembrane 6 superfamily member 1 isoform X2 n=1 Tax=Aplysia californica TaxID=6500 RepID=A0ABM0JZ27_APLCA|nr:transmembrane 6 superfamily member 1 isoform X2 [Aplysia californica]
MDLFVVIGLILVQVASYSTLYGLVKFSLIGSKGFLIGSYVSVIAVPFLTYLLFRRGFRNVDPLMYVFSIFSWAGLLNLGIVLELDGFIPKALAPFTLEYLPFLKTAHGAVYLYWDGVVNFLLGIGCIALYTYRETHREVGLYWAGSVLNGYAVLLPAYFTGKDEIGWTLFADSTFCVIPLLALINMIHNRTIQARTFIKFPPLWKRPVDLIFFLYFFVAMQIAVIRALAIHGANVPIIKQYVKSAEPYLADPSGAPKFQMLTYDYLYVCYYIFAMYGLWSPGQHWMGDFSLVHAGAAGQAQFTYMAGALNSRTSKSLRPPSGGKGAIIFWAVNGILFVMPHLFALFTQRDTEKFGRTQTIDFASPVRKYVYKFKETRYERKVE